MPSVRFYYGDGIPWAENAIILDREAGEHARRAALDFSKLLHNLYHANGLVGSDDVTGLRERGLIGRRAAVEDPWQR